MDNHRGRLRYPFSEELTIGNAYSIEYTHCKRVDRTGLDFNEYRPILRDAKRARRIRGRLLRRR